MPARMALAALAICLAAPVNLRADLKAAMAEPNLEKRSKLALDNARAAYQAARKAYQESDNAQAAAAIAEIGESVDLAYASLEKTGKNPRNSPKWFKSAELDTRDLTRKLDGFQQDMSYEDRPLLDKVKARVQQVHEDLLRGLLEGKRR